MTNEWGAPITGDEMKALKGRIDPAVRVSDRVGAVHKYWMKAFNNERGPYRLPSNHPYYKVREYNQKHGTNLLLHDGSAKVPEDWYGGSVLDKNLQFFSDVLNEGYNWFNIIAYTPKPKESEMIKDVPQVATVIGDPQPAEQFPKDEAIEYVMRKFEAFTLRGVDETAGYVKENHLAYKTVILAARLIQQYEPDRLKSAVDIAADEAAKAYSGQLFGDPNMFSHMEDAYRKGFKAGAEWQKENGNG